MRPVFDRLLVVFARAPRSEARDKGLPEEPASGFFGAILQEWREAARLVGARVAISAPPEDLLAWRRTLPDADDVSWISQRGGSFGTRLEDTSRRASRLARHVVVTGGDVLPTPLALCAAFGALASGADAVIAPAPDGGVSLIALPTRDLDLLRSIAPRRRDVFARLRDALRARRRQVAVAATASDVDGRRQLRSVLQSLPAFLHAAARRALRRPRRVFPELRFLFDLSDRISPTSLRAPPAAA
jgi:glycosyltransferase A (GT-A) superfamily protein (DUF2064 family)